jgi:hypothetical protein
MGDNSTLFLILAQIKKHKKQYEIKKTKTYAKKKSRWAQ